MIKFLKSCFYFMLFAIAGYCIMLTVVGLLIPDTYLPNLKFKQGATGFTNSRMKEAKFIKDLDVLFLGSSHAYRGFDTRMFFELGFTSFNLGSSTQTPLQTKMLLNRYLDQMNPKKIVFEVYPIIFCSDGVESALDIISNDENDKLSLSMASEVDHILIYNTLLYGYIRGFAGLDASFEEKKWKGISNYTSGGFVDRQLRYFKYVEYPKTNWKFNEYQFKYFEEILMMLEEKNIEVLLVYAPITRSKYHSYQNNEEFNLKMKAYGTYYNLNESLNLDDSLHFYDSNHLNKLGVEIFNESVLNILSE